jgi:hypothetical protein
MQHIKSCQYAGDYRHTRSESTRWRNVTFNPECESSLRDAGLGEKRFRCIRHHVQRSRIFVAFWNR